MSWSIFGRLFWKVWREDWKRWASVLAVGVAVICIARRYINVSGIPILFIYMSSFMAAIRGKRDCNNIETTTIYEKLPSIVLITIWASVYALVFFACLPELHTGSLAYTTAFMVTWFVSAGMLGYSLGIWSHPWFPAMITTLPFIAAFIDYISYHNSLPYEPSLPELGIANIAAVSVVIATLSLVLSTRLHKRMPTILQLILTICLVWGFVAGMAYVIDDDREHLGQYGHQITADQTLEVTQEPEGVATLSDYRTGRSYKLNIKKWGGWDRVIPVGIQRDQFVSAIALNSKKAESSIVRWNYIKNDVSIIIAINSHRYDYSMESGRAIFHTSSDDGRYLLLRLKSKLGNGFDYMVIDIPTRTTKMIMANDSNIYEMGFRSPKIATFLDDHRKTTRILRLDAMSLGPVIKWTGDDKR